jgi:RNA polymerase sigma-70 factor (ECF subfamily)
VFLLALTDAYIARNEDDLELIAGVKNRDQSALSRLYDRYATILYSMLLRMVRSPAEAQDLLQEVFVQIWNKAGMFDRNKGSVYTWIVTMSRRKAIDYLRSQRGSEHHVGLDDTAALTIIDEAYSANPLNSTIGSEYEHLMRESLERLASHQRLVLEMSFYEGFTQEQIAARLKIPLGTVKTRMRQGLLKLRQHLKERIQ